MAEIKKHKALPPVERIFALLDYNQFTGDVLWRARVLSNGKVFTKQAGKVAGHKCKKLGYTFVRIDNCLIPVHRLAFVFMTGKWPEQNVDHIDGNGANNAWTNLRQASVSQNMMNTRLRSDNSSGHKGVWFCRQTNLWAAEVAAQKRKHWVGRFACMEEAIAARREAAKALHGDFFCDGHERNLPRRSQQPAATPRST